MAGIYIHVPFCRKKCSYCDFFSVGKGKMDIPFADLILKELQLRYSNISDNVVKTIYFGGGTPSLLPASDIQRIILGLHDYFNVDLNAEITIEVNPDDVTKGLAQEYQDIGVNRVSIGVQSFNDDVLSFLGRRHNAKVSMEAIRIFKDVGISNISIDLIYGIPSSTRSKWEQTLEIAMDMNVQHLSCYHLTYEEGTLLTRKVAKGNIVPLDDEQSKVQFDLLRHMATTSGFIHYEISNMAKPGFISRHNSGYWLNEEYLGLGPSAHSYNKAMRWWNPASIDEWKKNIEAGIINRNMENIDEITRFNELLITRLRTMWGVNLNEVVDRFSTNIFNHLRNSITPFLQSGKMVMSNDVITIPPQHFFISDSIIADLLIV